jgi:hypothetical protein
LITVLFSLAFCRQETCAAQNYFGQAQIKYHRTPDVSSKSKIENGQPRNTVFKLKSKEDKEESLAKEAEAEGEYIENDEDEMKVVDEEIQNIEDDAEFDEEMGYEDIDDDDIFEDIDNVNLEGEGDWVEVPEVPEPTDEELDAAPWGQFEDDEGEPLAFSEAAEEEDDAEDLKEGDWIENEEEEIDIEDYDVEKEEAWRSIEDPLDTERVYFKRERFHELEEEWEIQRKIEEGEKVKFAEIEEDDEDALELAAIGAKDYLSYKTSEEEYEDKKDWGLEDDDYEESEGDKMYFYAKDTDQFVAA